MVKDSIVKGKVTSVLRLVEGAQEKVPEFEVCMVVPVPDLRGEGFVVAVEVAGIEHAEDRKIYGMRFRGDMRLVKFEMFEFDEFAQTVKGDRIEKFGIDSLYLSMREGLLELLRSNEWLFVDWSDVDIYQRHG